jgi:hypothetical protein
MNTQALDGEQAGNSMVRKRRGGKAGLACLSFMAELGERYRQDSCTTFPLRYKIIRTTQLRACGGGA